MAGFADQDDVTPFLFHTVSPVDIWEAGAEVQAQLRPAAMLVLACHNDGPTLVKSHHASADVNGIHLWSKQFCNAVVNPVRDPRDICCSFADHLGLSHEDTANLMGNRQASIGGDKKLHSILGTWSDHVASWLETDRVPVHTVRYEDMQEDMEKELREILLFLGFDDIDEDRLSKAVTATGFDIMKDMEDERGFYEKTDNQDRFFRKGETGGWEEELSEDIVRKIEDDHHRMMRSLGYKTSYL